MAAGCAFLPSGSRFRHTLPAGCCGRRAPCHLEQAYGALVGWLMIPQQQAIEVWSVNGGGTPQCLAAATSLDASPVFTGLHIDRQEIWQI